MTLGQAKDKFSAAYLGKNGIHAVGMSRRKGVIKVYAVGKDALTGIDNPYEGFPLELIVELRAKPAAGSKRC
ncbi:MAG TPA: hypothetical protein V6D17_05385 [Candidatus Obscuribacterales bacterium]